MSKPQYHTYTMVSKRAQTSKMISLINSWVASTRMIVRVGFILGNVTSRHDEARVEFMSEKYAIDTLIKTLKLYLDRDEVSWCFNSLDKKLQVEIEFENRKYKMLLKIGYILPRLFSVLCGNFDWNVDFFLSECWKGLAVNSEISRPNYL